MRFHLKSLWIHSLYAFGNLSQAEKRSTKSPFSTNKSTSSSQSEKEAYGVSVPTKHHMNTWTPSYFPLLGNPFTRQFDLSDQAERNLQLEPYVKQPKGRQQAEVDLSQTALFRLLGGNLEADLGGGHNRVAQTIVRTRRTPPVLKDIALLTDNPGQFLQQHVLEMTEQMGSRPLNFYGEAWLTEVSSTPAASSASPPAVSTMRLNYVDVAPRNAHRVPAYHLPSPRFLAVDTPSFMDLPGTPAEGTLIMLGHLGMSSVIIMRIPNAQHGFGLRLIQDTRLDSSVLHKNVLLAVNFSDYRGGQPDVNSPALAFMQFKESRWTLYIQGQQYRADGSVELRSIYSGESESNKFALTYVVDTANSLSTANEYAGFMSALEQRQARVEEQLRVYGISTQLTAAENLRVAQEASRYSHHHSADVSKMLKANILLARLQDRLSAQRNNLKNQLALLQTKIDALDLNNQINRRNHDRFEAQKENLHKHLNAHDQISSEFFIFGHAVALTANALRDKLLGLEVVKFRPIFGTNTALPIDDIDAQYHGWEQAFLQRYDPEFDMGVKASQGTITSPVVHAAFMHSDSAHMRAYLMSSGGDLSAREIGALVTVHSMRATGELILSNRQWAEGVLQQMVAQRNNLEANLGAAAYYQRVIPQGAVLPMMGDRNGRCMSLSLIMGAALARSEMHAQDFINRLEQLVSRPTSLSSKLLTESLVAAYEDRMEIDSAILSTTKWSHAQIIRDQSQYSANTADLSQVLSNAPNTMMQLIFTPNHAMLAGVHVNGNQRKYYFYDPNVGILSFRSKEVLAQVIHSYFSTRGVASDYHMYSLPLNQIPPGQPLPEPCFALVEIDVETVTSRVLAHGVTIGDLIAPGELAVRTTPLDLATRTRLAWNEASSITRQVMRSPETLAKLIVFDSFRQMDNFVAASRQLVHDNRHQLGEGEWVPLLYGMEKNNDGEKSYRIPLAKFDKNGDIEKIIKLAVERVSQPSPEGQLRGTQIFIEENTAEAGKIRWLNTADSRFETFRDFTAKHINNVAKGFASVGKQFKARAGQSDGANLAGYNSLMALQILVMHLERPKSGINESLNTAIEAQIYLNLAQAGNGVLQDVIDGASLFSKLKTGKAYSAIKTFGRTSVAADIAIQGVLIGFDIHNLMHADSGEEKAIFGTSLAFNTLGLLLQTSGLLTGNPVVLSVGVLVNIVQQAVNEIREVGEKRKLVEAVGEAFNPLKTAYSNGGFLYNTTAMEWNIRNGAIFKEINFLQGTVVFDSQYIHGTRDVCRYRAPQHMVPSKLGHPKSIKVCVPVADPSKKINIRQQGVKADEKGVIDGWLSHASDTVPLPTLPRYVISPSFTTFKTAARGFHGDGFDIVKNLESNGNVEFKFSGWGGGGTEFVMNGARYSYENTAVDIKLDNLPRRMQMSKFPNATANLMHYIFHGAQGGTYTIGLSESAQLSIDTPTSMDTVTWRLNASGFKNKNIDVQSPCIVIGNLPVNLLGDKASSKLEIIQSETESVVVTFPHGEAQMQTVFTQINLREGDPNLDGNTDETAQTQLNLIQQKIEANANLPAGQIVLLKGYRHNGIDVGSAYYDTSTKRVFFIDKETLPASIRSMPDAAQLAAVIADKAYFYNLELSAVVCTDAISGKVWVHHHASGQLTRVWQENQNVLASWRTTQNSERNPFRDIAYILNDRGKQVISIVGDTAVLEALELHRVVTSRAPYQYLENYVRSPSFNSQSAREGGRLGSQHVDDSMAPLVQVSGNVVASSRDPDQSSSPSIYRQYWLRKKDNALIVANIDTLSEGSVNHIDSSAKGIVLLGSWQPPLASPGGVKKDEIFYFYNPAQQQVYKQYGYGWAPALQVATLAQAEKVVLDDLGKIVMAEDGFLAITYQGTIHKINFSEDKPFLVAINLKFLQTHSTWADDLKNYPEHKKAAQVSIFGLEDPHGKVIPAWFCREQIVLVDSTFSDKALQLIDVVEVAALIPHQQTEATAQTSEKNYSETSIALIFNNDDGLLLQQALLSEAAFQNALQNFISISATKASPTGAHLDSAEANETSSTSSITPSPIHPASRLLEDRVRDVVQISPHELYITTREGLYLQQLLFETEGSPPVFKSFPHLLGVDKAWWESHQEQLVEHLEALGKRYAHDESIFLETELGQPPDWYYFPDKKIVKGQWLGVGHTPNNNILDRPRLIGGGNGHVYFFNPNDQHLWQSSPAQALPAEGGVQIMASPLKKMGLFTRIERFGTTLLLYASQESDPNEFVSLPLISQAQTVIVYSGTSGHIYAIDQAIWDLYRTIIIDRHGQETHTGVADKIIMQLNNKDKLVVREAGDDVVIYDTANKKMLILRNVLIDLSDKQTNKAGQTSVILHTEIEIGGIGWLIRGTPPCLSLKELTPF